VIGTFKAGERVRYGDHGIPAVVVGTTRSRVIIRLFEGDGRRVVKRVCAYRLHREGDGYAQKPIFDTRGLSMTATRGHREGAQLALLGDQFAPTDEPREPNREQVAKVFAHWQAATGRTDTHLDAKRKGKITRALASYPLADVLDAVAGWRQDPFYCGENDRSRPYNELTMLLRDAEHIERFRDMQRAGPVQRRRTPRQQASDVRRRIALG
jgi:hypothetical protein